MSSAQGEASQDGSHFETRRSRDGVIIFIIILSFVIIMFRLIVVLFFTI